MAPPRENEFRMSEEARLKALAHQQAQIASGGPTNNAYYGPRQPPPQDPTASLMADYNKFNPAANGGKVTPEYQRTLAAINQLPPDVRARMVKQFQAQQQPPQRSPGAQNHAMPPMTQDERMRAAEQSRAFQQMREQEMRGATGGNQQRASQPVPQDYQGAFNHYAAQDDRARAMEQQQRMMIRGG
jgi:hypothetical protein